MFTSRKSSTAVWGKTAWVYGILAAFCGIFAVVYLQFSHGESSPFLVWLFAPALLLGMLPALLMSRARAFKRPGVKARRIWNTAVATLSCGMLVRAIVNISGRYTEYDMIYWMVSSALFFTAIVLSVRRVTKQTETKNAACEKEL